jgi:hypothetical protein
MPQPDIIATAAQSASAVVVGAAASMVSAQISGGPVQIESIEIWVGVIAAFASAMHRPRNLPSYTAAYVVGTLAHIGLALLSGLAASRLLPPWFAPLQQSPSWAIVAVVTGMSHNWMPAIGPALDALTTRIAGGGNISTGEPDA